MNRLQKKLIFLSLTLISFQLSANDIFTKYMTNENKDALNRNETVIIKTDSYKKLSIETDNYAFQKLKNEIQELKPAYIAEVIRVYPIIEGENFIENFDSLIMDVKSYVGIPYFSERSQQYYDLYSSAEIVSVKQNQNQNQTTTNANLTMEPFGLIQTQILTEKTDDYYYYESTNLNKLRYYDKFDCVSPKNMKSSIVIFKNDNNWIVYSIGAVKAPSVFFLRDRIETSFMNRIKTFCSFFIEKI